MKVLVRYLALHDDLAEMGMHLWVDRFKEYGYGLELVPQNHYNFFSQYHTLFNREADIVIQLDEDCFLYRPEAIPEMIERMLDEKIAMCGMPEMGVAKVRTNMRLLKPYYINSFFMLSQPPLLRPFLKPAQDIVGWEIGDGKTWLEPYWSLFGYLHSRGIDPKMLDGHNHYDDISVILKDFEGKDMLIHTWFGRLWGQSEKTQEAEGVPGNQQRIIDAYSYACSLRIK